MKKQQQKNPYVLHKFSYEVENFFVCVRVEAQLFLWYDLDKADGLIADLKMLFIDLHPEKVRTWTEM